MISLGGTPLLAAAIAASPHAAGPAVETPRTGAPAPATGRWVERGRYLMGTSCRARAFGDPPTVGRALDAALDRIAALEDTMTTYREDGELARLNAALAAGDPEEPVAVSGDLLRALDGALTWARRTGGRFDPTIGALSEAWGLHEGGRRPTERELAEAVEGTSWRWVELDAARGTVLCRRRGISLDLGGFGKGYALDAAAAVLRERGVSDALLDFGGQVLALGSPAGEPGWIVEIADPRDRSRPVLALRVRDLSVATSGNAERSFVVEGRTYGHLLDPRTGQPAEQRGSVTVLAAEAGAADALATALAVSAPGEAPRFLPPGAEFVYLEPPEAGGGVLVATATAKLRERLIDSTDVRWNWCADGGALRRSTER